jgi:branched-chain amino acid transport system ATP-binding protein
MSEILKTEALTKLFGGFCAVDRVTLAVKEGTIHSVIGPNGAGKSTLFKMLTGTLAPSTGRVWFAGHDITGRAPHLITRLGLAQSFQITSIFPRLSVLESLKMAIVARLGRSSDFFTSFQDTREVRDEALEIIEQVGLADSAHAQASTLSHGDQRALEVALALATKPRMLLLDEPTAGMSPWETRRMVDLVRGLAKSRNLTVLFCEHDMDVVFEISELVTVMHQGRVLVEGAPDEVRRNELVAEVYLGSEAHERTN